MRTQPWKKPVVISGDEVQRILEKWRRNASLNAEQQPDPDAEPHGLPANVNEDGRKDR